MFQTEINHFFQSFASDGLTSIMQFITALGYQEFFFIFLLILLFAVDFKKAFILFMILLWTGVVTYVFKHYFDLPRPFHVDNTIELLDGDLPDETTFNFSKRGAKSFWEGLPPDVLEATRKADNLANGFPSGHSSIAIAFWGGLIFLFRNKWVRGISITLMILIPLSRIYLGVHFLADVTGGVLLGAIMLWIFYLVVLKEDKLLKYLQQDIYKIGFNPLSLTFLIAPFLFFFFIPPKAFVLIAFLWSFGLGFLLLARRGLPLSGGTIIQKVQRLFLSLTGAIGVGFAIRFLGKQLKISDAVWFEFILITAGVVTLMWLGVELSIRLGWYKRRNNRLA